MQNLPSSLNAGCRVIFDEQEYRVYFMGKVVQVGYKDPATDFWTMSITGGAKPKSRTKLWKKESRVGGC